MIEPMLMVGTESAFHAADWAVLAGYLLLLVGSGVWVSRFRPKGAEEYFIGDKRLPVWAVALSVLATTLSAATFIGAPVESYTGDLTYLSTSIGGLVAIIVVAKVFIPAFYRNRVTTVYQLLEGRFGPGAKLAASWTFMIGRVFASGARLYMAAIPLTMILYGDLETKPGQLVLAISILSIVAVLYAIVGGIKSIIWADVVQTVVFIGAAVAALIVLLWKIPAPVSEILSALHSTPLPAGGSKLTLVRSGIDLSRPWLGLDLSQSYTLITALTGFTLLSVAAYGTDQDMVQRMLTCRNAVQGGRSAIVAILAGIPVVALFLAIGLLLYVFNKRPELMSVSAPEYEIAGNDKVFPQFILRNMPHGLSGLFMAGLFAIALTSLMSALNAMSSALVTDVYRPARPGRSDAHYLAMGRLGVAVWGVVLAAFASLCVHWQKANAQTLIPFALGVMGFAYAGLLGVFLTALFTNRGTARSAIAAIAAGFVVVLAFQPALWIWVTNLFPTIVPPPLDATAHDAGSIKAALPWLRVAFPWHLLIGTLVATSVCCSVPARKRPSMEPGAATDSGRTG